VRTAVYMKERVPAACINEVHDYVGTAESAAGVACDLRVTGGYGSSGGLVSAGPGDARDAHNAVLLQIAYIQLTQGHKR
jgi:hypothetical protein